ncbi:MAG: DUF2242 domain-containing protein [Lautropia sp.]
MLSSSSAVPRARIMPVGRLIAGALVAVALIGCSSSPPRASGPNYHETFDSASPHARAFPLAAAATCEAARRALLSHGYVVTRASGELVNGRKSFQPSADSHVEIEFHVVCAVEGRERSTVFVNAIEDRYALKKVSTSASLGVGPVGSLSLPFGSSNDSLVKVASETIAQAAFYDRFFGLIEHFLAQRDQDDEPEPETAPQPAAPGQGTTAPRQGMTAPEPGVAAPEQRVK